MCGPEGVRVLFGGSFDPVHLAHVALADAVQQQFQPLEIVWIPARISPFKTAGPQEGDAQRLELLHAVVDGRAGERVDPAELETPAPSYSVETVLRYRRTEPAVPLAWLMGADSFESLHRWHRVEELLREIVVLVAPRPGSPAEDLQIPGHPHAHVFTVNAAPLDLSSSAIRARIASGESLKGWLPEAVAQRIQERGWYGAPA